RSSAGEAAASVPTLRFQSTWPLVVLTALAQPLMSSKYSVLSEITGGNSSSAPSKKLHPRCSGGSSFPPCGKKRVRVRLYPYIGHGSSLGLGWGLGRGGAGGAGGRTAR